MRQLLSIKGWARRRIVVPVVGAAFALVLVIAAVSPGIARAYSPDFMLTAFDANAGSYTIDPASLPADASYTCQFPRLYSVDSQHTYSLTVTDCQVAAEQATSLFNPQSFPDGSYVLHFDSNVPAGPIISQAFTIANGVMTGSITTPVVPFLLTAFDANNGTYTIDASSLPGDAAFACQIARLKSTTSAQAYALHITDCQLPSIQATTLFTPTSIPDDSYELIFADNGSPTTTAPVVSQAFTLTNGVLTTAPQLSALTPAKVWVGLKNSDDVGVKFDLLAQAYKNNTLVASGQVNSFGGGSSGFNNAHLATIPFDSFAPVDFATGSQLKVTLSVRNACSGSGHNSGMARLWYNDSAANSQFGATITTASDYFLRDGFALATTAGPGPKKTVDVQSGAKCSAFKPFGTWTITP